VSPARMRVAHVVDHLGLGGAESMLNVAARALRPHGVEMSVLSLRDPVRSPVVDGLEALGVEILWLPSQRRRALLDPERLRRVRAALRGGDYDLVQTHLLYSNVVGTLAAHNAGIPVVATLHQSSPALRRFERERELIEAIALRRRATRVVAVGRTIADVYRRRLGGVPVDVVSNPVATAEPVAAKTRDAVRVELLGERAGPLVVAIGRLVPVKGLDDLITAFRDVAKRHPGAVLAIAGKGPMRATLEAHVRAMGLDGSVRLLGIRTDVPALLAAADLFVMSSRSEGLPLALLEAMYAGKAVVATSVGGVPEVVRSGENGLLVSPGSDTELADAIATLARSAELRNRLGAAARETIEGGFTEAAYLESLSALYVELAEAHARSTLVGHRFSGAGGSRA
jgi:glycosyltransferase involved in cell wall biosynthesis